MKKKLTPQNEGTNDEFNEQNEMSVVETNNELARPEDVSGGVSGEWDANDVVLPILSLCQKSGDLSEEFKPGTWVYDKQVQLTDGYEKDEKVQDNLRVPAIVLSLNKYWRENKDFNTPGRAKEWDTREQAESTPVVDATGCPIVLDGNQVYYERGNKGEHTFAEAARCVLLVRVPEEYAEFTYDGPDGEEHYARAFYRATSTAWQAAKMMFTAAMNTQGRDPVTKKPRPHVFGWELGATKITGEKNTYWKPRVFNKGRLDESKQDWVDNEIMPLMS